MLLISEGNTNMVTDCEIYYDRKEDGFNEITFVATSGSLMIDLVRLALQAIFVIFFFFNLYLFANTEYSIYQRYKKWKDHNIKPLTRVEKDQRN